MAFEQDPPLQDLDTEAVLEQGDELLRSSRDLLAELDARLSSPSGEKAGDELRKNSPNPGDS